jgi:hypothetical protein
VGKAFGYADPSVTLAAHLPPQPFVGLDRSRYCAGLACDLPDPHRPTVLVHFEPCLPFTAPADLAAFGFRQEFLGYVTPGIAKS